MTLKLDANGLPLPISRSKIRNTPVDAAIEQIQQVWEHLISDLPFVTEVDVNCGFSILTFTKGHATREQRGALHERELHLYDLIQGVPLGFRITSDD
jgi:hypothetical protein